MFAVGNTVTHKRTGRTGEVIEINSREVVVRFAATGETRKSPWGDYRDAGETLHLRHEFSDRFLSVTRP